MAARHNLITINAMIAAGMGPIDLTPVRQKPDGYDYTGIARKRRKAKSGQAKKRQSKRGRK